MKLQIWLGVLITFVFLVVGTLTLPDYGLNEDSPFHFLRGQAYLHLLTTGENSFDQPKLPSPVLFIPGQKISSYKLNAWEANLAPVRPVVSSENDPTIQLNFAKYQQNYGRQSFYKHNAWSAQYFKNNEGPGHPPVSDILSAFSNQLFYEKLGILGDVESYHFYAVITASVALFLIFFFTLRVWGVVAAFIATLSLAFYPIFFAESHFNIKDVPQLSFFSISLIAFYFWVTSSKFKWFTIFTISTFLALGTKLNAVFLPMIVLPWLLLIRNTTDFKKWFSFKLIILIGLLISFEIVLFIITWPHLWDNPVQKIAEILNFYQEVSIVDPTIQKPSIFLTPFGVDLKSLILVFTSTPIVMFLFFLVGLFMMIRAIFKHSPGQDNNKVASILIILWLLVPILRVLRPGADIFGSIRQFMEFLPALSITAGVGGHFLIEKTCQRLKSPKEYIVALGLGIYFVYLGLILLTFHPNQNLYFSLPASNFLSWQTSYDNPYRQGVRWLNQNAPKGAKLAFLDGTMTAISPIWLRDDIYLGSYFSGFDQNGEYIISIVYPDPPKVFQYLYLERFLDPIYQIKVGEIVVANVWRNNSNQLKDRFKETVEVKNFQVKSGQEKLGQYWEIQLDREYKITKLSIEPLKQNCQNIDGLFYLTDYIVPQRIDKEEITEVYFPGEKTDKIRFWSIDPNSCFKEVKVLSITVLKNQ